MAKGLYGLHHAAITAGSIGIVYLINPIAAKIHAYGMIYWYVSREWDQYEHRTRWNQVRQDESWYERIEWWDWISPTVVSALAIYLI